MRIIYNTSFIINEAIEKEWVEFIRQQYIDVLNARDLCDDIIFTKVLIDQPEGKTYSLQIVFGSEEQQNNFLDNHLSAIEEKMSNRYRDSYVYFNSILSEI